MLFFFPRGVLGEILNLIESVSEGFPSYFFFKWALNRTIIIYSANMYLVNLLLKRFRLSASSDVYYQLKVKTTKLKYLYFTTEI